VIGIYLFYENWSTETYRKTSQKSGLFERVIDDPRRSFCHLGTDGCISYKKPLTLGDYCVHNRYTIGGQFYEVY
jgi:hypothetical protein